MKTCETCKSHKYIRNDYYHGMFCINPKLLEMIPQLKGDLRKDHRLEFHTKPEFGCNLWSKRNKKD